MGLCFVSRTLGLQRIDGCRSQPVQTRKARMAEKRKQQWRESEANGCGKERGRGLSGGPRTLGLIYGFTQTNPPLKREGVGVTGERI